jgi:hypothetical protein
LALPVQFVWCLWVMYTTVTREKLSIVFASSYSNLTINNGVGVTVANATRTCFRKLLLINREK